MIKQLLWTEKENAKGETIYTTKHFEQILKIWMDIHLDMRYLIKQNDDERYVVKFKVRSSVQRDAMIIGDFDTLDKAKAAALEHAQEFMESRKIRFESLIEEYLAWRYMYDTPLSACFDLNINK